MEGSETTVHEPEVVEESKALAHPGVPVTIEELASLEGERGLAIIEQRVKILNTLRVAAIGLTMPSDWVLFKTPDGIITGFLSDTGCDRIKKLFGIQVSNLGKAELIEDSETQEFAYRITGDGHCGVTGESVFEMEGVRYSTEPFAQQKPEGIQRTVAVQKAARANLDGGITRELAGLKSVPVEELTKAWEGSWRKWEMCSKGRGFGSGDSRVGAGDSKSGGIDQVDVPMCDLCKVKLVFRANGKPPFWGCPSYSKHPDTKVILNHDELLKQIAEKKAKATAKRQPGDEA